MAVERILITVKTYPTLSDKYDELVCTAGVREDGSWIRIYPIPFRKLDYDKQYPKYTWIEANIIKNKSDPRIESFKLVDYNNIVIGKHIPSDKDTWEARRPYVLKTVYQNMTRLIQNSNDNNISLATFKPPKLIDFIYEEVEREWDPEKLASIHAKAMQVDLFCGAQDPFKVVKKLPYKFSYVYKDEDGKKSKMMIEDWEIGQMFWNSLSRAQGNEKEACEKVKQKYWNTFKTKDLHFFLGTTRQFHRRAYNPFIIIGVFYPNYKQPNLFDQC